MKLHKKGQSVFDNFGAMAIGVGALCITLVVAFLIMAQANTNMNTNGYACEPPSGHTGSEYTLNATGCCLLGGDDCTTYQNVTGMSAATNSTRSLQNATAGVPGWVSIVIITANF